MIRVYDAESFILQYILRGHNRSILALCALDDKKILLSTAGDRTVRVWSMSGRPQCLATHRNDSSNLLAMCNVPSSSFTVFGGGYDTIVYALEKGLKAQEKTSPASASTDEDVMEEVKHLEFQPCGRHYGFIYTCAAAGAECLVTGGGDSYVKVRRRQCTEGPILVQ